VRKRIERLEVAAAQHLDEGGGQGIEAFADVLAVANLAGSDEWLHLGEESVVVAGDIVADEEVLHGDAAADRALSLRARRVDAGFVAAMGDEAADGHARTRIEERQDGIEHGSADIFEIGTAGTG
jgi:hypothetical protein